MKKCLLLALILPAILAGCKKNLKLEKNEASTENTSLEKNDTDINEEFKRRPEKFFIPNYKQTYFISQNEIPLYERNDDDYMIHQKYSAFAETASKLEILYDDNWNKYETDSKILNPDGSYSETKKFTLVNISERSLECYFSLTFWVESSVLADLFDNGNMPCTSAADLHVYTDNNLNSITDTIIPDGTRLVVEAESTEEGLRKACLYDGNPYGKVVYIDDNIIIDEEESTIHILKTKLNDPSLQIDVRKEIEDIITALEEKKMMEVYYYDEY